MSAIAELAEERVVEGVYAVARKQRMRTKGGAPYLALELVDPSGRIDARVWHDVELLDARFTEGDAVRVLGRVEKFRDRLQVDVRTLEAAPEADPADFAPAMRRDAEELDGFLEFLAAEIVHPGLASRGEALPLGRLDARVAPRACRLRRHTTRMPAGCSSTRSGSRRSAARRRSSTRVSARTSCSPRRSCTTSAASRELTSGPTFRQTDEGRLLGHVHLGLRLVEERGGSLEAAARSELLHAIACHHDARSARTAEASVLYHANQLDAVAATRPVPHS